MPTEQSAPQASGDVERSLQRAEAYAIKVGLPFRPWTEHLAEKGGTDAD